MDVRLIEVPYMAGDDRHGSSEGPRRLLEAGAETVLASRGVGVTVETIARGGPFRDTASSSAAVNKQLAAAVRRTIAAGELPLVVAGSCVACQGVLAGFDHARCGAVWLDAHADFNTPESTVSGFFPGMSAAVITGRCYRDYWAQIGYSTPVAEEAIVMLGVRDLSPEAERKCLEQSAIEVVPWRDGRPRGDVEAALDGLARRVDEVYLHLDMDCFDPEVAPGVVDEPVPGGLSLADAEAAIRATVARFRIRAATLATFTRTRSGRQGSGCSHAGHRARRRGRRRRRAVVVRAALLHRFGDRLVVEEQKPFTRRLSRRVDHSTPRFALPTQRDRRARPRRIRRPAAPCAG